LIIFLHTTETFHFFLPIWIRLEGSYIFKVFKDLLMIFVIQNFASFFSKLTKLTEADFNSFLFARFSHNQPLLFLNSSFLLPSLFKPCFTAHNIWWNFWGIAFLHTHKIVVDFKESKNVEMSNSLVSKTLWNNTPEEIAHPVHCLKLARKPNVRVHVMWFTSLHPPGEDTLTTH
jgi:hypothetical protein